MCFLVYLFVGEGLACFCVYSCLCDFGCWHLLSRQLLPGPGNILGQGGLFSDDLEHFHISILAADR